MTRQFHARWWSPLLLVFLAGCSVRDAACGRRPDTPPPPLSETQQAALEGRAAPTMQVAFLGDSLTAGYGLLQNEAYPALIEQELRADGYTEVEIVNAGISGDTTAGGLARLDQVLEPQVKILVVALGANDALRGLPPSETRANLARIIATAQERGVMVLLAGMLAPPNLGTDYADAFGAIFPSLSVEFKTVLLPFLLEGIAGQPSLNQEDGIHPTAEGQKMMAQLIYPKLKPMIDDVLSR